MLINYAYHVPVGCMAIGLAIVLSGFVSLVVLYGNHHDETQFRQRRATHYLLALCGFGAVCLILGCCSCCTIYNRIQKNWNRVMMMQHQHQQQHEHPRNTHLTIDRQASSSHPIITGYDPRFASWTPL